MTLRKLLPLALIAVAWPAAAGTPTTNYGWSKPTVSADADTWGTQLNTDLDGIDAVMFGKCSLAGCAMTGTETLAAGTTTLAPLKLQSGSVLATPSAGAVEWDGTHLFVTQSAGPTRRQLAFIDDAITGSAAKWTTGRTITLTGNVTGVSSAFDGSANLSFATTIAPGAVTSSMLATGAAAANLGYTPANEAGDTFTGKLNTKASAAGGAGFSLAPGAAPTTPANGDCWLTSTLVACEIGGASVTLGTSTGTFVTSFDSRTGAVTLSSADVTTALGYTPLDKAGTVAATGKQTLAATSLSLAPLNLPAGANDPSSPSRGDVWNNGDALKYEASGGAQTLAFTSSNITGSAAKWTTGRTIAFSGDVTGTTSALDGSANLTSQTLTIASGAVTNAKMANETANTVKCNNTGSPAALSDCTVAQVNSLLNVATTSAAGTVKIATVSQIQAGSDNTAAVTASGLANSSATSTSLTFSAGTAGAFTPGFTPVRVQAYLICNSAVHNYQVGDVIMLSSYGSPGGSGTSFGVGLFLRGSSVEYIVGGNGIQIVDASTGGQFQPTGSNFSLYIQAWSY
jgi:hypothetical protein